MAKLGFFVVCLIVFATAGCKTGAGSETRDVQDIAAVTNGSAGMTVVCKDGTTTELTALQFQQQVTDNTICDGVDTDPENQFMCVAYSSSTSQVARIDNGQLVGTNVSHVECQNAIQASRRGLVCAPYSGATSQVYQLANDRLIGSNLPHAACNEQVKGNREGLVCAGYSGTTSLIYRLSDAETLGTNVTHEICAKLVGGARSGMVCAPYSGTTSQVMRISNKQTIGSNLAHDLCIQNLPQ